MDGRSYRVSQADAISREAVLTRAALGGRVAALEPSLPLLLALTLLATGCKDDAPIVDSAPPSWSGPQPDEADVVFREVDGQALTLDLWRPEGEGPFTGVMIVHGGAFVGGDKSEVALRVWADEARAAGLLAMTVNYRLSEEGLGFPAPVEDLACARAYARETLPELDGLAFIGFSAGATLANLVALDGFYGDGCPSPEDLQAPLGVVSHFGVSDWVELAEYRGGLGPEELVFMGTDCDGESPPAVCEAASPLSYVGGEAPPFLLLHAPDDRVVPPEQTHALQEALNAAGVSAERLEVSGLGHGFHNQQGVVEVNVLRARALEWVSEL